MIYVQEDASSQSSPILVMSNAILPNFIVPGPSFKCQKKVATLATITNFHEKKDSPFLNMTKESIKFFKELTQTAI